MQLCISRFWERLASSSFHALSHQWLCLEQSSSPSWTRISSSPDNVGEAEVYCKALFFAPPSPDSPLQSIKDVWTFRCPLQARQGHPVPRGQSDLHHWRKWWPGIRISHPPRKAQSGKDLP